MKFVKPDVCLIKAIGDGKSMRYSQTGRIFIITDEAGMMALRDFTVKILGDEGGNLYNDFIYTTGNPCIISVQSGIFETFIRLLFESYKKGNLASHILVDIMQDESYLNLVPLLKSFKENEFDLKCIDNHWYDILSTDELSYIEGDAVLKHTTPILKLINNTYPIQGFVMNLKCRDVFNDRCINYDSAVVPYEVAKDSNLLKAFKVAQIKMHDVMNSLSKVGDRHLVVMNTHPRELMIEVTLYELLHFLDREFNSYSKDMNQLIIAYLIFDLIQNEYAHLDSNAIFYTRMDSIKRKLATKANEIADAISVWNNI